MRAAEHERVDTRLDHRREQSLGEHVHLIGVDVALLDELDEAGAGAHVSSSDAPAGSASSCAPARWYAPEAIVPTVAITPTRPVRVARRAARRPVR